MNQETLVKPEPYVKICMALVAVSLITIAVCQVILVTRPPQQPMMRRQVGPMEGRMMQPGQAPVLPGMVPPGGLQGQGMPEGQRPNPPLGQGPSQSPAKK